jgi:hypothetical protein
MVLSERALSREILAFERRLRRVGGEDLCFLKFKLHGRGAILSAKCYP